MSQIRERTNFRALRLYCDKNKIALKSSYYAIFNRNLKWILLKLRTISAKITKNLVSVVTFGILLKTSHYNYILKAFLKKLMSNLIRMLEASVIVSSTNMKYLYCYLFSLKYG